jgi:hypothetical protein
MTARFSLGIWRICNFPFAAGQRIVVGLRRLMDRKDADFSRVDLHRRIALVLRKEPGLIRDFADRLRSKLATARSPAAISDNDREWYIILTLWSPLQVIRLLEDSSERAVRLRHHSPFLDLLSTPTQRTDRRDPD